MDYFSFFYIFFSVFITLLGFVIGSFLNVVIYRTPMGRTISKGHSMCMTCSHELAAKDLVPVFSWVFLGGKCRYCKAPIPSRYFKIETLTGCFFLLASLLHISAFTFFEVAAVLGIINFSAFTIFLYHFLFLIASCAVIAAMMIWYDTSKCFLRLPVTTISLAFAAQIFVSLASHDSFKQFLLAIGLKLIRVLILPAFSVVIFTIFRKKYTLNEIYLDLTFSGILLFSYYLMFINGWVVTSCFALLFALLRVLTIGKKANRYVGIIGAATVVILLIISYIIMV